MPSDYVDFDVLANVSSWRQAIRRVESPPYAVRILTTAYQQLGFTPPKSSIIEASFAMSSAVAQMHAYYVAAQSVTLSSRPILLYYGMLHLAKAIAIIANPYYGDTLESQKHGLSIRRKKGRYEYFKDRVFIQKNGVFLDWYTSLHMLTKIWPIPGMAVHARASTDNLAHASLPVLELWRCLPDLAPLISLLGKNSRCTNLNLTNIHNVFAEGISSNPLPHVKRLAQDVGLTLDDISQCLQQFYDPVTSIHGWSCIERSHNSSQGANTNVIICVPPLSASLLNDFSFPEPLVYFALLFQLSMLQRYEPMEWVSLTNDPMSLEYMIIEVLGDNTLSLTPYLFSCLIKEIEQTMQK